MGYCCGSNWGLWYTAVGLTGVVGCCNGSDYGLWDSVMDLTGDCVTLL